MFLQEGVAAGTDIFEFKDGLSWFYLLEQLEDTIVVDSSDIMFYDGKFTHSSHDFLFVVDFALNCAGIDFLLEDELEVVAGVGLVVAYVV